MSDYGIFKFGGVTYPVPATPFVQSRTALSPVISAALLFYKAMLETHLGAYFAAMVTDAEVTNLSSTIVTEMVGYDPTQYLKEGQYKFPLMALHRTEIEISDHTVAWYKSASTFVFLYVLPPLTVAQANRIVHILEGVRAVIVDRTIQGYDPAYQSGAEVWTACGVMSIGVKSARIGQIRDLQTNLFFPALEMTIECEEREQTNPGLDDLSGVDTTLDVSNGTPEDDLTVSEIAWEIA